MQHRYWCHWRRWRCESIARDSHFLVIVLHEASDGHCTLHCLRHQGRVYGVEQCATEIKVQGREGLVLGAGGDGDGGSAVFELSVYIADEPVEIGESAVGYMMHWK